MLNSVPDALVKHINTVNKLCLETRAFNISLKV
jgi:hypothetical protein